MKMGQDTGDLSGNPAPLTFIFPRKVIQITSQFDSDGRYLVLAICNDGTLWKLDGLYEGSPKWEPFPQPPKA